MTSGRGGDERREQEGVSDPLDLDSNDRGSDWIRQGRDLRCVECDRRASRGAPGWRAYRTLEHDGSAGTAVYCPSCARREFSTP